ncbi:DNA translocase FtsK [Sporosarcina trichiuri]|uniref:DNA translocase FtsK n=1 Tax=Sporosarcina trichiuri TaxID=3056445 RepID=UPI0025B59D6D|nr:DNA translocase FtsK [Sporosarcina sp. 0.2-SM1T-5]WJY27940.1 DNA translocase FtsK [Sporosarcina sp. 0.2-SM1T-5]
MSWIKKTMGRLFGQQSDELSDQPAEGIQNQESRQEDESQERRAFRFPMITDAEIYGWDEESGDIRTTTHDIPLIKEDDRFERATPLFENRRWPAEQPKGEVHRAGTNSSKYRTPAERLPAKSRDLSPADRKREIVEKRIHTPFTPTEVPSPVYGFSKRKPPSFPQTDKKTSAEQAAPAEHQELRKTKTASDLLPSGAAADKGPAIMSSEELQERLEGPAAVPGKIEQNEEESNPKALEETPAVPSVSEEPAVRTETTDPERKALSAAYAQTAVLEREEPAVQEDGLPDEELEDASAGEQSSEPIGTTDGDAAVPAVWGTEEIDMGDQAEDIEGAAEETPQNQEKIVPFNVLMLKSDKEKLRIPRHTSMPSYSPASAAVINEAEPEGSDVCEAAATTEAVHAEAVPTEAVPAEEVPEEPSMPAGRAEEQAAEPAVSSPAAVPPITEGVQTEPEEDALAHYVFPSMEDLLPPEEQQEDAEWLVSQSEKLVEALSHFAVHADILEAVQGPTVTRFELTVGFGTKVSKVRNLTDDLKLALAAEDIRIQAPIPGTSSIGIEIPNRTTRPVRISEVIGTEKFLNSDSPLEAVLGLSLTGEPVTLDLRKMPHGMIAGATGSGKSVCINSILVSLLYKASPADVKLMLIDPKMVELAPFNGVPHLISPVITDVKAATAALKWAVDEMERRYELFAHAGARNIERYNRMAEENRQFSLKMPYLVIVIDELADLMMVAPSDVEVSISRIAQKARACGIHLIIATQRPSVDVITGIIKANIPTRIAFAVSSQVDSRTIIDSAGAERLLGRGDMLYIGNGQSSPVRLQGTFVTDDEIEQIIDHVKSEASPDYLFGQDDLLAAVTEEEESDPLFVQACSFIIEQGSASTSLLQRHFSIGYNRAAKLMDRMETHGFISEQRGSRPRDVYVTQTELDAFLNPSRDA